MKKRILFIASFCMMLFFAVMPTKASDIESDEVSISAPVVSPQLSTTTLGIPDLTVTNLSSSMKISWTKVPEANGYYIYKRTASGKWSSKAYKTISKNSTTSFEDKTYKAGTGYYYRAVAYKKVDGKIVKSDYSEERYIKRLSRPTLSRNRGNGFITVTWSKISGATGYIVYRDGKEVANTTDLYYHDTDLKDGKTYSYTVKAYHQTSEKCIYSSVSKALNLSPKTVTLKSPVCELENTGSSIHISWSPVPGCSGYFIYRRTADSDWDPIPIARISGTYKQQYNDKSFTKGTLYYYQVRPYKVSNGERLVGDPSKEKHIMRLSMPAVSVSNAANGVKISWGSIAGAQLYAITRDGKRIATIEDTSYIDTDIINGSKYVYKVRALYRFSEEDECFSEFSYTDTIYRLKNMTVTELKAGPERFKVTYKKNPKATGYEIVYSRNSDFSNAKSVKTTSTYKTVKYLEAEETYYVKVRSYKKVGSTYYYSNYSDVQTVVTE